MKKLVKISFFNERFDCLSIVSTVKMEENGKRENLEREKDQCLLRLEDKRDEP